ncbi:MAG: peptide chain release factor N(5)-glutamine methyltransferase [Phycisphaerae bacterium]|nr:peptide chain release factor N(5)-glutamine methyltransferase [Phycisphaerae bacterium]
MVDEVWTIKRLLEWTREHFEKNGVESPRLCAEVLLADALGYQRLELYARFDQQPSPAQRAKFRESVTRCAAGKPMSYIVGKKEFYSLPLTVTPDVLIPRSETELLVDCAVDYLRKLDAPATVWDVCTGSGCVALSIAKHTSNAQVLATDISPQCVTIAAQNAADLELDSRVTCMQADLLALPQQWASQHGKTFDVITANPPYVCTDDPLGPTVEHEPQLALFAGDDGLDVLKPLIAGVAEFLKSGGIFCVEFGYKHADVIHDLIVATDSFEAPAIIKDHQNISRAAVAIRAC